MNTFSLNRRRFLQSAGIAAGALATGYVPGTHEAPALPHFSERALAALPVGSAPAPVATPHFPSRLHAFVWRNWSLVPPDRMAAVVGATQADILRLGTAMGLGQPPRITADQQRRSYITVIRRNWHLLPYEQLLALLDWTPEQLAFTLREDDFLYIKLGSLKPKCAPLRYTTSDEAMRRREAELAQIVRQEFPSGLDGAAAPLFAFVDELSATPPAKPSIPHSNQLRFCYSYFALYGDPLLEPEVDPYPDGLLARLADTGVNGVWLQAVLYKLARFPWEPSRSARYTERLANLRALVARARRYGIQVFLYLNEPRAMPLEFFRAHPELKGVTEGDHAALCTSVPAVRQYLSDAVASICRAAPDLGGFFTITASENLTNCWSHGQGKKCPRCRRRGPATVIAEVNATFQAGLTQAGGRQRLIAWDWGWNDAWAANTIAQLPAGISLMSVSEWDLPIDRGGVKSRVGEYSISAVGPGPRALSHWQLARQRGLQAIAKIQASNSWELSTVPYIPALGLVAEHATHLRKAHVDGLMLSWTLGGYPSPNLEVVGEVLAGGELAEVARRRFGATFAPAVMAAWQRCSEAFRQFPFHIGVVYNAPLQVGPANPLWAQPTGYHCTMTGFPYDDLDGWRAIYPAEIFVAQLEKVASGFTQAASELEQAVHRIAGGSTDETGAPLTPSLSPSGEEGARRAGEREPGAALEAALAESRLMAAAGIHWQSVANQSRFILARRALAKTRKPDRAAPIRAELRRVLEAELALARQLWALQSHDSRIGFEASNQYFYVPLDLAEKVLNCRYLLAQWGLG